MEESMKGVTWCQDSYDEFSEEACERRRTWTKWLFSTLYISKAGSAQ